jgi:hypothetical protein
MVSVLAMVFLDEELVWIQVGGAKLIILSGVATNLSDIADTLDAYIPSSIISRE